MNIMRLGILPHQTTWIRGVAVSQGCSIVLSLMFLGLPACGSEDEQRLTTSTSPTPAGSTVSLVWDPVNESNIVGYYIHYGKQSPNRRGSCEYDRAKLVSSQQGIVTEGTVTGLDPGSTYYFAVNAYNGNGAMGDCSNEVQAQT